MAVPLFPISNGTSSYIVRHHLNTLYIQIFDEIVRFDSKKTSNDIGFKKTVKFVYQLAYPEGKKPCARLNNTLLSVR